jgi:hypothetical protein
MTEEYSTGMFLSNGADANNVFKELRYLNEMFYIFQERCLVYQ